MSYILDALRKSDRERTGERTVPQPGSAAPGFRSAGTPARGRRLAGGAAACALLIGIGAGVWIGQRGAPASPAVDAIPAVRPAATPTSPTETAPPAPGPAAPPDAARSADAPPAREPAALRPEGILELWQLTEAEQRYLQALDVTLHVHSSDPSQRAVIINGLRAREGQDLGEALRLAEIVPDGLILEFQGQLVHLPNPQPY